MCVVLQIAKETIVIRLNVTLMRIVLGHLPVTLALRFALHRHVPEILTAGKDLSVKILNARFPQAAELILNVTKRNSV